MKKFFPGAIFCIFFLLHNRTCIAQTDVLMQHNDLNRTGWNNAETILNQSNVTPTNFGLLYKRSVDDQIFAQPLVVSGVNIAGASRNVVYVATVNNSVYAFDADDGTANAYWQRNFTPSGEMVPNAGDIHAGLCGFAYSDFQGINGLGQQSSFGIVGTPVIDKSTNTIYFVSRYRDLSVDDSLPDTAGHKIDPDWSSAGFFQIFHALDLSTGADKFGSPQLIDPASTFVTGSGEGSSAGILHFDPRRQNQRGGLAISNGVVYISWAGHCDMDYYHGWIVGYKASDITQQLIRYTTTPNDGRGGIWMSGAGPAIDSSGNLYFASGNANNSSLRGDLNNVGLSVTKASPDLANHTLTNISWYKPTSYTSYNISDLDFATGIVLIPGTTGLVTAHKSGNLILIKQNASPAGEFTETSPNFLQSINLGGSQAMSHSSITYFGGSSAQYIYTFSEYTPLKSFQIKADGTLGQVTNSTLPTNVGPCGGYMSVSSNGTDPNSAILWVTHATGSGNGNAGTVPGTLHAVKANDVTTELWNSDANPIDKLGFFAKMTCVSIANGKVYAPTFSNSLNVYGLLSDNSRCVTNVALNKTATSSSNAGPGFTANLAFDGNTNTVWGANTGDPTPKITVDLGGRYDICKVTIQWNNVTPPFADYAVNFTVDISDDNINWTTLNTVTGNSFSSNPAINLFNEHATGRYVRMNASQKGQAGTSIQEMQVFGSPASNCVPPSVGSLTATNITQNSATLGWNAVTGVTDYVIKYKGPTVTSYITRTLHDGSGSGNPLSLNISALTCGFNYQFQVQSNCGSDSLSAVSSQSFQALNCTNPCGTLTRFSHGDLGDIQAAGMSCYTGSDSTFTVTGAGNGLGGDGDQFQFYYASLSFDEDFIMRVASQDASPASNQAGIMMRDSLTDISRFIFIGKTGGNNLLFIYRNANGGAAVTSSMANSTNANFFRIVKAGTQYAAFYANSGTGPWTQMGTTKDLGFGAQPLYIGMGVSSVSAPTAPSMATFDNLFENATPLPIQLVNFAATKIQNQYVSLKWQTAMEENNDYFDVERSTDGRNYIKITTVKAVGNSSTLQSYAAVDNSPANGINFYRLKQVDLDNRFTYSPVQKVKFSVGVAPVIYPNPVNSSFTAVAGNEPILEIVVYSLEGKAVKFEMGNTAGDDTTVNISNLAPGIYIVKLKTVSKDYQLKIVKE